MLLPSSWHAGTGQYVHVTVTPTNSSAAADDRVDDELHATHDGPGLELNRGGTGPDRTAHRCSVPVSDSHCESLTVSGIHVRPADSTSDKKNREEISSEVQPAESARRRCCCCDPPRPCSRPRRRPASRGRCRRPLDRLAAVDRGWGGGVVWLLPRRTRAQHPPVGVCVRGGGVVVLVVVVVVGACDGEGGEVAQELPVREEGQAAAARRRDGRGGGAQSRFGAAAAQGQEVELQAGGAGREGRRGDAGRRVRPEEARRGGCGGDRRGRRRRGGRGARGGGRGAPVLSPGVPRRGRGGGQDPGDLQRLPGEDGAVRAAGHREAPSSGARPAGEEAGERHAPLHAGAAHGAVPPAGAAHACSPAGAAAPPPPPPPAAAAQATAVVAAAPEAPPILRDGQVLRGERQDRGDGHRRAGAARRGQGQAAPRRAPRPVLPGAVGGDGAEPEGVQRPLRRVLGGHGAEQPAARVVGGLRGVPELHGQHRVVPRQGAVPERAAAAHRRAGAPAEPQEGDPAEGRQDAAVIVARRLGATRRRRRRRRRPVVAVVCGPEAVRLQRVAQGQRVRVHHLRAHRGHRLQPDAVARRVRGATWPVLSPCPC